MQYRRFIDLNLLLSAAVLLGWSLTHSEGHHGAFRCASQTLKSTLLHATKGMCSDRDVIVHSSTEL